MADTPTLNEPGHILVVDDDRILNDFMSALLRLDHHSVSQALSAADALRLLEAGNVDLVLTDLMMPGETGIDLIVQMKAIPRFANIPTILISAIKEAVDRGTIMAAGADDFLPKPLNKGELRARVYALLRLKRAYDALEATLAEKAAVLANFEERVADLHARHRAQLAAQEQKLKAQAIGAFTRYADHQLRPPLENARGILNRADFSADDLEQLRSVFGQLATALDRLRNEHATALQQAESDAP